MALQLTGAFKQDSLANLQVRLPAIVIGGGLTAIDTATEVAAYYPVQVEKFLERWEALGGGAGAGDGDRAKLYDRRGERDRARVPGARPRRPRRARAGRGGRREPDFAPLVAKWGGVSLVYRKRMTDSPAYRLNHEEIDKFLEEGVRFIEHLSPVAASPTSTAR